MDLMNPSAFRDRSRFGECVNVVGGVTHKINHNNQRKSAHYLSEAFMG